MPRGYAKVSAGLIFAPAALTKRYGYDIIVRKELEIGKRLGVTPEYYHA